jgi:hypothetical protein
MPGLYDDVGFDAYGAGREARNQLNNAQAFGRGVKQVASGVAEMPGKTWDGMMAAGAPLLDRQFAAMEAQGRAVRGAGANFMRGFDGPADAPYAEDAPRTASPRAALPAPAPTQRPDDITGSAARIQAANPRGGQAVPQMARTLVQESQQRFAPQQEQPQRTAWDQLMTVRALSDMTPQGGYAVLGDPDAQDRANAAMGEKWAREDMQRRAMTAMSGSGADARARMATAERMYSANLGADTQRQNALLGYQGGRERDASAERIAGGRDQAAFGLEGMRGKNQLAAEGMRGGNQLAAERMRGENQFGLEGMRRAGRMDELALQGDNQLALQDARYGYEAPERTARIRQANTAADMNEQAMATAKGLPAYMATSEKRFTDMFKEGLVKQEDFPAYMAQEEARYNQALRQQRYAQYLKEAGKPAGYAGGGVVDPATGMTPEQKAKRDAALGSLGMSTATAQPQGLPAPVQKTQAQGAPAPVGYMENVATGGLQRRMREAGVEGRADGGQVGSKQPGETDQAYLARISKQGQDYTSGFGKPGLPSGVPGMVSYEPGGVQRRSFGGIDHITDPNVPGGANYQPAPPSGLAASGGYGTYSGSGQARGVTPWDQTPGGQAPQSPLGETPLMGSSVYNKPTGLAFGGAVPPQDVPGGRAVAQAVAGRQVFGQSDGSGEDDALPAVIDGERPAALTSGEFVWPVKAVQFYGMDKLNKMLAAAEKGMAAQGDTE